MRVECPEAACSVAAHYVPIAKQGDSVRWETSASCPLNGTEAEECPLFRSARQAAFDERSREELRRRQERADERVSGSPSRRGRPRSRINPGGDL